MIIIFLRELIEVDILKVMWTFKKLQMKFEKIKRNSEI